MKRIGRIDFDFKCKICGKTYKSKQALDKHIKDKHTKNKEDPGDDKNAGDKVNDKD